MKLNPGDKIVLLGGHLTPALAVIEELKSRGYYNLSWIGTKFSQTSDRHLSAEYQLIHNLGLPFYAFRAGKIWRKVTPATFFKAIFNLLLIPYGFIKGFLLVLSIRPKLIISFGGYLALPVVIAGRLSGAKIVTHEQTISPGIANKLIGFFADKILISWPDARKHFPAKKTVLTGNPLRKEILRSATSQYTFPNDLPIIYVTGGNQGANTINWRLLKILAPVLVQANIIHQTGSSSLTNDFSLAMAARAKLNDDLKSRYLVREHIFGDEIGEVFAKAALIVSRSGANTITEILALGKPSLLIPLPWSSGDEQLGNAELVAHTGLATILKQYDAMPPEELQHKIESALDQLKNGRGFNGEDLVKIKEKAAALVKLNAAAAILDEIQKLFP
jgi:UDP-N-acetylglucosamine--N-acetylmuramyl-(pentapeptide) pyrophosphoryl-undecaprenol N-acetylglucosamine transferase